MRLNTSLRLLYSLGLCRTSWAAPPSASPIPAPVPIDAPSQGTWDADQENENHTLFSMLAAAPLGSKLDRSSWKVTCDSQHAGNECGKAIDGNTKSFWHSGYVSNGGPVVKLPHSIVVDLGAAHNVNGMSALPRQDDSTHGYIGQHSVYLSMDGKNWGDPVALGNWWWDKTQKFSNFEPRKARYVRLVAESEAFGNQWTSIADLNVYATNNPPPTRANVGRWGPTIDFPVIPVQIAVEPTSGKVLVWSAYKYDDFHNPSGKYTLTAEFDPKTGQVSQRRVQNTKHDMFCPGISMDGTGQIVVTGGNTAARTSIFDPPSDSWISGPDMQMARGYQSSATCSNGKVFTIGGSWSGGRKIKNGEIYDPAKKTWTMLPGALVQPMLTKDPQGIYRADNHAWLFGWKDGTLFQAGPSTAMHWYYTNGQGDVKSAGDRKTADGGADPDSMCGNAVMFDAVAGKILTVGGSPAYQDADATKHAHIITIGDPGKKASVKVASKGMFYKRIFANSVVLPNGHVFINGGQEHGIPFKDSTPVMTPEMYYPESDTFHLQQPNSIVRVYHSASLLLPDATIFTGGGGLCGSCETNHFDAQIYTPAYLLNSDGSLKTRVVIKSATSTAKPGGTLTYKTNSAAPKAALIRYGTATHAIDTDQRRVPLTPKKTGTNSYSVVLPKDPGILIPGYWMLFAIGSNGAPSVAATIKITV